MHTENRNVIGTHMGARRIFSRGKFRDALFPEKVDDLFSRHPQNTGLNCNY